MAAKRLGQALSNVEGTSKQILRVKTDESGFEFVEPATIPEYTITNSVTDRAMDANDTTLDELADVVSTLIADLEAAGLTGGSAGLEAFQWSTSEQVWPFEKDASGNTLYCKQINLSTLPDTGNSSVAHNISNLDPLKVHELSGIAGDETGLYDDNAIVTLPAAGWTGISTPILMWADRTNIVIYTAASWPSNLSGKARIIYSK